MELWNSRECCPAFVWTLPCSIVMQLSNIFFSQPRILTVSVLSFSLSRSISTHSHWNSLSNNNRLVNTMIRFWNDCNDIICFHKNRCGPLFFTKNFFHHPSLSQSYRLVRWLMSKASYNRRSAAVQPRSTAEVQRLSDPPAREGWEKKKSWALWIMENSQQNLFQL